MNEEIAQDSGAVVIRRILSTTENARSVRLVRVYRSLAEAVTEEPPNGVYLVARTYRGGRVLELDRHFDRLESSAAALGRPVSVPRGRIRRELASMHAELREGDTRTPSRATAADRPDPASPEARFRVTLVLDGAPWLLCSMERAREIRPQLLREGVVCALAHGAARRAAAVKSTEWMHARAELVGGEAYETLLTNEHGAVLEGATSNFYAVVGGTVYTAGESVLEGTARRIVLYVMRRRCDDVRVELRPVTVEDIRTRRLDEAFLTSSTRGVVPIRRIDRIEIGPPGSVTRTVMRGYQTRMEELLEPLSESSA